jgi:hypothetical protein
MSTKPLDFKLRATHCSPESLSWIFKHGASPSNSTLFTCINAFIKQFYSEAILTNRGALARVWLAAHMERKLSKSQTLQTDITQSVGVIMGQDVEVMALRLSGQLLLGVVRIYSRKAKYLLDDCNEALLKIKMVCLPLRYPFTDNSTA